MRKRSLGRISVEKEVHLRELCVLRRAADSRSWDRAHAEFEFGQQALEEPICVLLCGFMAQYLGICIGARCVCDMCESVLFVFAVG
jgi:hypothetical protein